MASMQEYFERHPNQYFSGAAAISTGILIYAGRKAAAAVAEGQPTPDKGPLLIGVAGLALSVVGLVGEAVNSQE